jgi:isoleucyl-tRNA synthetase
MPVNKKKDKPKKEKNAEKHHVPNFLEGMLEIQKLEEKVLVFWDEHKIFEKSLEKTKNGKPFTFYDGPPFATGLPHYGHLLASTIKDVIPRYQTMKGRFVRRRWGWDCHGLPIEEIVERKLGISGKKQIEEIGIKKFNETCRSMVLAYTEEWGTMIRRIARWVEFKDSYKTMDTDYMESVWWAFKQIYEKNLIYEGRKVLLYCPRCETPVSNFEVAMDNSYKDVTEESVTLKFKVESEKLKAGNKEPVYLLAWTTTPWTLPGNVALAVGEKIEYTLLRIRGVQELYIVASDRISTVFKDREVEIVHAGIKGKELVGLSYEPLFEVPVFRGDKSYKIYLADFVTTTDGTGVVHTAVVYGEDDYALGVREGLPIVPLLDEGGSFNGDAPEFLRGMYFKKSEKFIKEDLERRGLLFKREMYPHSYPFCWRCGNVLFYNAIPAWFINVQKIKTKLLASNRSEINWFPEHLKAGRYAKSVEAAPDWNISRNRYWGNPIPVWKCAACHAKKAAGSIEELSKMAGGSKNNYWVMRHGEAESNLFNIINSKGGAYHLTPRGKKQVVAAIKKLKNALAKKGEDIDIIIASDVMRTKETEDISEEIFASKKVLTDARLEEIHLGPTLDGYRDIKYYEYFPTYESRFEKNPEGGESLRDVRKRVWEFLSECEKKYKGKNILLISHEYPIWMLSQSAEGWSEKRAIAEKEKFDKEKKDGTFVDFAEVRKLNLLIAPRNESGEVDLHRPYIDEVTFLCESCGNVMRRTSEIFDSWMEAGSMPFSEYHYPFENKKVFESRFPAQFVAEYIAQTRAWFYVMHVISIIIFGHAPFENVVTTGTILAEDGSKMSKSKANFPDPKLIIDKYGADSLRFYLMNSVVMQADNLNFSEKGVEGAYRKVEMLLFNVYKYFATYIAGKDEIKKEKRKAASKTDLLDVWVATRTEELLEIVTKCLELYDTVRATRAIQEYVDDLSTWYLRRSRKRKDRAFFETLSSCLFIVSIVIAPFMPFFAEALYGALRSHGKKEEISESVHLVSWPKVKFSLGSAERKKLCDAMVETRRLASIGLAKRAEAGIKVRQPLQKLKVKSEKLKVGKEFCAILADEVNVKAIVFDAKIKEEVELDTVITPALREEGLVREFARAVQELRQTSSLRPQDVIVVAFDATEVVRNAVVKNEAIVKAEIGAKIITVGRSDKCTAEATIKMDGVETWIGIREL